MAEVDNAVLEEAQARDYGTSREDFASYGKAGGAAAAAAACAAVGAGAAAPACAIVGGELGGKVATAVYDRLDTWFGNGDEWKAYLARQKVIAETAARWRHAREVQAAYDQEVRVPVLEEVARIQNELFPADPKWTYLDAVAFLVPLGLTPTDNVAETPHWAAPQNPNMLCQPRREDGAWFGDCIAGLADDWKDRWERASENLRRAAVRGIALLIADAVHEDAQALIAEAQTVITTRGEEPTAEALAEELARVADEKRAVIFHSSALPLSREESQASKLGTGVVLLFGVVAVVLVMRRHRK